jgi:Flp pilus assembly protein TadB
MTLLKDLVAELVGMFVGDAPFAIAILFVVGLSAALIDLTGIGTLTGGVVLVVGCLLILFDNIRRSSRRTTEK